MARISKGGQLRTAKHWAYVYRQRHRLWAMMVLPTMPDGEWKQYQDWVRVRRPKRRVWPPKEHTK